jgi:tetratricopeptide (TPR) repeat protein
LSKGVRIFACVAGILGLCVALGVFVRLHREMAREAPLPDGLPRPQLPDTVAGERALERVKAFARARAAVREDFAGGEGELREFMKQHPGSGETAEGHIVLAEALTARGDTAGALRELDAVIAMPDQGRRLPRALLLRAALVRPGDEAAARRALETVRADIACPGLQAKASLQLGLLELGNRGYTKAIPYLDEVIHSKAPETAQAVDALRKALVGHIAQLAQAANWQGVLEWSQEQIKHFPELAIVHHVCHYHQAIAYRQLGQFAKARVYIERLRRDVPKETLGEEVDLEGQRAAITTAEEAAGILRTRQAFLRASQAGKDTRTHFEGEIAADTTWRKDPSPLVLTGPVTVRQGATLTIEPGLTVQLVIDARIVVEGALVARGTAQQPIRLTSAATGAPTFFDGEGIEFADSSLDDRCVLEHCVIEYQRTGVACQSAAPLLRHCTFSRNGREALLIDGRYEMAVEDCTFEANDGTAIHAKGADVTVRRCRIADNGRDGISLNGRSSSTIEASRIAGNGVAGIVCDNGVTATVKANEIAGNHGDGVYANRLSILRIEGNIIRENQGDGIRCERDSSPEILGNAITRTKGSAIRLNRCGGTIRGNNILRSGSNAIHLVESASPLIEGNWLQGNHGAGVACSEACAPTITGNAFINHDPGPLSTLGKMKIMAQRNYFGTMPRRGGGTVQPIPDEKLDKQIFDKTNMAQLGEIVWRPRLDQPPPRPPMPELPTLP